jgi:hypothetical protein
MANNKNPQSLKNVFLRQSNGAGAATLDASVRQDKARISSARVASPQPAAVTKITRAQPLNNNPSRSQNNLVHKTRAVHLDLWVDPIVKAELQRIAKLEELTVSKVGASFLTQALQNNVDMHYSALLEPIIESAIRKEMQGMSNRFAWLITRNVFASEQTRAIATNILGRQSGMTEETLKTILAMTKRTAKGTLTRRNPELEELIDAVKQWLNNDEAEKPNN